MGDDSCPSPFRLCGSVAPRSLFAHPAGQGVAASLRIQPGVNQQGPCEERDPRSSQSAKSDSQDTELAEMLLWVFPQDVTENKQTTTTTTKKKKKKKPFGQPKSSNWFGGAKKCLEGLLTGTLYMSLPRTASPHGPGKEEGTSSPWTFQSCRSTHGNNLVPLSSKLCHPTPRNRKHNTHAGRSQSSRRDRERERGPSNVTDSQHPVRWKPFRRERLYDI